MFHEKQINIFEWFLKDRDTEDWSYDAKNSAAHHRNNYFLQYIQIESSS